MAKRKRDEAIARILSGGLHMNPKNWGLRLAEKKVSNWPVPTLPGVGRDEVLFRGITVNAPAKTVFRWLCQLRVAPYSYDWIDNFGRRSPPRLTATCENLKVGQSVMTIFRLAAFERDVFLHLVPNERFPKRLFGDVRATYRCVSLGRSVTRLLVRLEVEYEDAWCRAWTRLWLPWGDLFMMRKQLFTLRALAEMAPGSWDPADNS